MILKILFALTLNQAHGDFQSEHVCVRRNRVNTFVQKPFTLTILKDEGGRRKAVFSPFCFPEKCADDPSKVIIVDNVSVTPNPHYTIYKGENFYFGLDNDITAETSFRFGWVISNEARPGRRIWVRCSI